MDLTPTVVEGYVSAKVLVAGLKRAGPKPTREGLRKALVGVGRFDVGCSPTDHSGLDDGDLAIVDQSGKFRR